MAEYFKHEIAKWNVATDDLTLEQEAAYHRVVSQIRLYERPFRHNLRVLSGLWRCNERKAKRLLEELIEAGKLSIEDGLIVDEKAVHDASTLRQSRIDKQSAGRLGGIESGKSRRKSLKNKDVDEACASTREEKAREEKSIYGGGGGSAGAREDDPSQINIPAATEATTREALLSAMGVGPDGIVGPSRFIGTQGDMAEAQRWLDLPGITLDTACAEIRRLSKAKADGPPSSFKYFTPAIQRLSGQLSAEALAPIAATARASPSASRQPSAAEMMAMLAARQGADQ